MHRLLISPGMRASLSNAQCNDASLNELVGQMKIFYASRGKELNINTELFDLHLWMLGKPSAPDFMAKGAETMQLLPFFVELMKKPRKGSTHLRELARAYIFTTPVSLSACRHWPPARPPDRLPNSLTASLTVRSQTRLPFLTYNCIPHTDHLADPLPQGGFPNPPL